MWRAEEDELYASSSCGAAGTWESGELWSRADAMLFMRSDSGTSEVRGKWAAARARWIRLCLGWT